MISDALKVNYIIIRLDVSDNKIEDSTITSCYASINRNKQYILELAKFIQDNKDVFGEIYQGDFDSLEVNTTPVFCPDLEDLITIEKFSPAKGVFSFFALLDRASKAYLHECIDGAINLIQ